MFRPNRIGTPVFHQFAGVENIAAWTPNQDSWASYPMTGNVINASPGLDFQRAKVNWTGTSLAITAENKFSLGQQFTVTKPAKGNVVAVELNAHLIINIEHASNNRTVLLTPVFCKLNAAGGALFAAVSSADHPTYWLDQNNSVFSNVPSSPTGIVTRLNQGGYINKQIVIQDEDEDEIAGTYFHGFTIWDYNWQGYGIDFLNMTASVRQYNDQQVQYYRDILR